MAKFSWLADHARVTNCAGDSDGHAKGSTPCPSLQTQPRRAPLLASATEFLRAGRPADAIAPLRDAALLQPSNAAIQHDLGLACLEVGRVPDAIAALQRAVAGNPRYTDAYLRLGIALEKLGDIRGAIVAYDRATELLPSLTEAWFSRRRPGLHPGPSRRGDRLFPPRGGDWSQDRLRPPRQGAGATDRGSQSGS